MDHIKKNEDFMQEGCFELSLLVHLEIKPANSIFHFNFQSFFPHLRVDFNITPLQLSHRFELVNIQKLMGLNKQIHFDISLPSKGVFD